MKVAFATFPDIWETEDTQCDPISNLFNFCLRCFMKENKFQALLIKELKREFPGCIILKNDPNYIQGIPDLLILFRDHWAALECKQKKEASHRPNQEYYVSLMNEMSYAQFIYPENKEEILDELQHTFRTRRSSRLPQRKQVSLDKL